MAYLFRPPCTLCAIASNNRDLWLTDEGQLALNRIRPTMWTYKPTAWSTCDAARNELCSSSNKSQMITAAECVSRISCNRNIIIHPNCNSDIMACSHNRLVIRSAVPVTQYNASCMYNNAMQSCESVKTLAQQQHAERKLIILTILYR